MKLRLGTRKSPLALAQSRLVARALEALDPEVTVELVTFVTRGDRTPGNLAPLGGKGLFTEELEAGLLDGSLDLAVHSLKDLPVETAPGLVVVAHPERADPRDVLVSELSGTPEELPDGAVVLTGALRRRAQLLLAHPGLDVRDLRGSVGTRIARWREQDAAGVILAAAGLDRLGDERPKDLPVHPLSPERYLPAPGQGTLAVQVRDGGRAHEVCAALDHRPTSLGARAERLVVQAFGGNCALPLAAYATVASNEDGDGEEIHLRALLATPDGSRAARGEARAGTPEEAAEACVTAVRAEGAREILDAVAHHLERLADPR